MRFFPTHLSRLFVLVLLCVAYSPSTIAQLRADFSMDKSGGCSPLVVAFTNNSSGASAAATWQWDFGNGNTSNSKDPGAVFQNATTYAVKLRVTDGAQVSEITKTVTVYKKPVIDFSVNPASGCTPYTANFSATASGGDGTISTWRWDFGDGSTELTDAPNISHLYTFTQEASVSVTAVSNYGCSKTILKPNLMSVKNGVVVNFSANQTNFCTAPATVNFTNNSTGAGTLTYLWNFGDNQTSTLLSPSHTYAAKGRYNVTLTVSSTEGCTISKTESEYIVVDDFVSNFDIPTAICFGKPSQFKISSQPLPTSSTWYVNGTEIPEFSDTDLVYNFPSAGTYSIRLVNNFSGCQREVTRQIVVSNGIIAAPFIITPAVHCTMPPHNVTFKDTTAGAVKWKWRFDYSLGSDDVNSTTQEATYGFSQFTPITYNILLEVENAAGCTAQINQWMPIDPLRVSIYLNGPNPTFSRGCDSITHTFGVITNRPITTYLWDFGDGFTSTDANPTHTYRTRGEYFPKLKFTTADGCTGESMNYDQVYVFVMKRPEVKFTINQPEVCGKEWFHLNPTVTGDFDWIRYDFGDNTDLTWSNGSHQYTTAGVFNIMVIAQNNVCNDTLIKPMAVTVRGPFEKIGSIDYSCAGDRSSIVINDMTTEATKWTWEFGDGQTETYTTYKPTLTHIYPETFAYVLKLTVENGTCIRKDSVLVPILKKQTPKLSFDAEDICISQRNNFHIRNLERHWNWYDDSGDSYSVEKWEWKDGSPYQGTWTRPDGTWLSWYDDFDAELIPQQIKKDSIRMIIRSRFYDCLDTTNYVLLNIKGVITDFATVTDNSCFKSPVVFQDNSLATAGSAIVNRTWDFGDGQQLTTTQGGLVRHTYASPGRYVVTLSVADGANCISSKTNQATPVRVNGAKAAFHTVPESPVAPLSPIDFINTTNTDFAGGPVTYAWDFGDGATAATVHPVHAYAAPGTYTVRLIALDNMYACRDTFTQTINVVSIPMFTTTALTVGDNGSCPPVQASFAFTSGAPYTHLVWTFGDGVTLEDQTHPVHIYTSPGKYQVTLRVYHGNALLNTYIDYVEVALPPASIAAADISACIGDKLELHATYPDLNNSYAWDFGNGTVVITADSTSSANYPHAGSFTPSVIVTDARGCSSAISLTENVVVHPDPLISVTPNGSIICKGAGVHLIAQGASSYTWSPSEGLSSVLIADPIANPANNTTYMVEGIDVNGCKGKGFVSVEIPKPFSMQALTTAEICAGDKIQLSASGANNYKWINVTDGLSSTTIPNPSATPGITTNYTLVGYDQYMCYTDTAHVTVYVRPSPNVTLGSDIDAMTGIPQTLTSISSPDVTRWEWTPTSYLSCTNCPTPVARPMESIQYKLTVYNQYNCKAEDSIRIAVTCGGNIYVSSAFTPNNDGKNDYFSLPTQGIGHVISFQIFNRWGKVIFQQKNYTPGGAEGNWNGRYRGVDLDPGVYVYVARVECEKGMVSELKGTVTLLR